MSKVTEAMIARKIPSSKKKKPKKSTPKPKNPPKPWRMV